MAARFLYPWNSPSKNTEVGCHFLLQGISPTQGLNLYLQHCKHIFYCLSHQGSPIYRLWFRKSGMRSKTLHFYKLQVLLQVQRCNLSYKDEFSIQALESITPWNSYLSYVSCKLLTYKKGTIEITYLCCLLWRLNEIINAKWPVQDQDQKKMHQKLALVVTFVISMTSLSAKGYICLKSFH